jgi:hypothetical protein
VGRRRRRSSCSHIWGERVKQRDRDIKRDRERAREIQRQLEREKKKQTLLGY